jgi:hypothetical protein
MPLSSLVYSSTPVLPSSAAMSSSALLSAKSLAKRPIGLPKPVFSMRPQK